LLLIAELSSAHFVIPVVTEPAKLEVIRMAVPVDAVDEYGDFPASPDDVRFPRKSRVMATVTSEACFA
jgi:hypothetical protein